MGVVEAVVEDGGLLGVGVGLLHHDNVRFVREVVEEVEFAVEEGGVVGEEGTGVPADEDAGAAKGGGRRGMHTRHARLLRQEFRVDS